MSDRPCLLSIPPELREIIYTMSFTSHLSTAEPLDVLLNRVPGGALLRATCKFICSESERCYDHAEALWSKKRYEIREKMIQQYIDLDEDPNLTLDWQGPNLQDLALSLMVDREACQHECKAKGCWYACNDRKHRECFDCGKNVIVALYCKLHSTPELMKLITKDGQNSKMETRMPVLVVPETCATKFTPLGHMIKRNQHRMTNVLFENISSETKTSWAYEWFFKLLQIQRAVDFRCGMRSLAVKRHFSMPVASRPAFTEGNIKKMELLDRRCHLLNKITRTFCKGTVLEWRGEYERRSRERVVKEGMLIEELVPRQCVRCPR